MTTDLRSLLLECEINRTGPIEITPEGHRMIEEARNAEPDPRDAEIARLRALVKSAFYEGMSNGLTWSGSHARKALGE
ncbi:hypothetical protein [Gemmatimonas sp.]|uniref:hypothetical protein n=1 Tax=Gemmatimonas sp. TaxID=1962908 RepID=UPI0033400DD3